MRAGPGSAISVIVPAYRARYLADTLQSVFDQTRQPDEVIVVNDGSGDDVAGVVRQFGSSVRYCDQPHRGTAAARNLGVEQARGAFLAFLDDDDLWSRDKLSRQSEFLMQHPDIQYVVGRVKYFVKPGARIPAWFKGEMLAGDHPDFTPGSLMARRGVFDVVGLFDTSFALGSDFAWVMRARERRVPMALVPEVWLHKRIHERNHSAQTRQVASELLKIVRGSSGLRATRDQGDGNAT